MDGNLTELITTAFTGGASDLFITEGERPRVRHDGEVIIAHGGGVDRAAIASIWNQCGLDPERDLDGDASLEVPGAGRLRVNAFRTLGRLAVVMRPIKSEIPDFDTLGLPGEVLGRWLERRSGLVLVTGPTGSGKSTTVAACLQWINQREARHIVTIEDPIEYLFRNDRSFFSQREVHHDTGDFEKALRQALRQNPDVIFFGEIRDSESALSALRAAETGHLVISTIHGSGVSGVPVAMERVSRLVGDNRMGASGLLSQQLIGVISQQLLPRLDGGMAVVLEFFENVAVTRKWIAEGRFAELRDHVDECRDDTACSFLRYLVAAVEQNIIDPDTARASSDRPQDLDRALRGIS
ncbi:type IV pilus twitching motility protein PilT [Haloferula sp. A504]|uniref:type IV pilus twitching motility protein PilT n=1 Tax=Haloferula sp. A504 TaxID=3373601 RepID=UPI0031CBAA5B|nr:Flp pilus assembly complex ATPase component TadA [Verrucomicrobiaceae bacterium E54]